MRRHRTALFYKTQEYGPELKKIFDFFGSLNKSVGGHSDEFCAFKPKHALFFVIPAKAGIQIRDDPVDCVSEDFSVVFPLPSSGSPLSRG
jgi:hypothetical protein